ncbi:MAG: hypothetical protein AAFZ15_21780 [Bacteroidota bacterium]
MKINSIFFLLLLLAVSTSSCSSSKAVTYQRSGKVTCSQYAEGVITVISEANAQNKRAAVAFAERNAVENLLFKGIPSSNQEKPIIPNEPEALQKNTAYFSNLIDSTGYQKFIMHSEPLNFSSDQGTMHVKQKIKFDLNALRSDLEQNKIIRKFGL